jgi:glycerol-3-phosphate dehydrogenase (NAD(P)+)
MGKICVIGDGGWGTALSILLRSKGLDVILWSAFPEYAEYLRKHEENTKFLKGIPLPAGLKVTSEVGDLDGAENTIFVVPCEHLRNVAEKFKKMALGNIISATKGIENGSLKRPSEILSEYFPKKDISVLSGPSISWEVAKGMPTTVVIASDTDSKTDIQTLLMTGAFRVYTSSDMTGVELGGALKNVVAIAAGISDGMGFGTNAKAGLLTRGLAEITRLGVKMGAESETFRGLSGLGDLATTCISIHSRNRWFGEQVGKGREIKDIMAETEMVVEGMATARSGFALSKKYSVEMPIVQKVYEVIYEGKKSALAVKELMTRSAKEEDYD